jgi:hypothetical protein
MSGYQQPNPTYQIPPQVLQALMQHLQQQQQVQNAAARAPVQTGAVGGPMPTATPPTMPGQAPQQGNTPQAGGPLPITGGGTPPMAMSGVQGQVPLGGQGIPAMQPKPFGGLARNGGPGGANALHGANPFQFNTNPRPPMGSGGGAQQIKMDQYGNYYYGTDPNAADQSIIKNAGQLLQNLNPVTSGQ